jgi:hypothetical protein
MKTLGTLEDFEKVSGRSARLPLKIVVATLMAYNMLQQYHTSVVSLTANSPRFEAS